MLIHLVPSEQESVGEVPVAEYEIKKGKDLESIPLDSDHWEKNGLKKNASKTELPPLTSDRDTLPAKSRTQTPKARQSQSGPLMAGAVLSHSASERARNSERFFTTDCFLILLLSYIAPRQIIKGKTLHQNLNYEGLLILRN